MWCQAKYNLWTKNNECRHFIDALCDVTVNCTESVGLHSMDNKGYLTGYSCLEAHNTCVGLCFCHVGFRRLA